MSQIAVEPTLWSEPELAGQADYPHNPATGLFDMLLLLFVISIFLGARQEAYSLTVKSFGWLVALLFPVRWLLRPIAIPREFLFFLGFIVWGNICILLAQRTYAGRNWMFTMLQLAVFFFIIVGTLDSDRKLRSLAWAIILAVVLGGVLPGAELGGTGFRDDRLEGTMSNANYLGTSCVIALGFSLFLAHGRNPLRWIVVVAAICTLLVVTYHTGSRNSSIGVMAVIVLFFWFRFGKKMRRNPALLVGFVAAIITILVMLVTLLEESVMIQRWQKTIDLFQGSATADRSVSIRLEYATTGIIESLKRPIFGGGIGYSRVLLRNSAHNDYITLLLDTGWLGTALYYSVFVSLFLRLRRLKQWSLTQIELTKVSAIQSVIVAIAIMGMNQVYFYVKVVVLLLAGSTAYAHWLGTQLSQSNRELRADLTEHAVVEAEESTS